MKFNTKTIYIVIIILSFLLGKNVMANNSVKQPDHIKHLNYFAQLIEALQKEQSYTVNNIAPDIYHITPKSRQSDKAIAISALTHGDEVLGLSIFHEILLGILEHQITLQGDLYLILSNRAAYLKNQRYIDIDLNRVYDKPITNEHELKRVAEIKPILDKCDFIVDIHQTIEDTKQPFFILPFTEKSYEWAHHVAPRIPIMVKKDADKITTMSTYGASKGKLALTFEVGGSGVDLYQLEIGFNTILKFIEYAHTNNGPSSKSHPMRNRAPVYEVVHFQPYSKGRVKFIKDFINFEDVTQEQVIATLDDNPITTPISGKILLYPQKWFKDNSPTKADGLFAIVQELNQDEQAS